MYTFKKDVHLCSYKTKLEDDQDAVMMLFSIRLPNTTAGSSASSEKIMEVVGIIEKVLAPIHDYKLLRDVEGINKSMALLKIVKIIDNEIF